MKEKKHCDICENKMKAEKRKCEFQLAGEMYHGEALIYHCEFCGYEKLGTCEVKFWENDEPIEEAAQEEGTAKNVPKRPNILTQEHGKVIVSDDWLDWMLENKPWFIWFYAKFVSKRRQEKRYLNRHLPVYKAILNDVLYDTETSKMYLMEEKDFGNEICRMYYYMTPARKYFRVIVKYNSTDEIATMELKDVKKLLAQKPDIYKDVVPDKVVE